MKLFVFFLLHRSSLARKAKETEEKEEEEAQVSKGNVIYCCYCGGVFAEDEYLCAINSSKKHNILDSQISVCRLLFHLQCV